MPVSTSLLPDRQPGWCVQGGVSPKLTSDGANPSVNTYYKTIIPKVGVFKKGGFTVPLGAMWKVRWHARIACNSRASRYVRRFPSPALETRAGGPLMRAA